MNPFFVAIQPCEITRGDSDVISAAEFMQSVELQTMESQVKERIQVALKEAHMQREQARQQAEQYIIDAQNEAKQLMVQWEQQAKSQAIHDAVAWVQDELRFRQELLEELSTGIAKHIRSVIVNWADELDKTDLIVSELTEEVIEKLGEGAITLLVAEPDFESLSTKLGSEFKIKVDTSLSSGAAELQSSGISARIDLNQHLELLLEAFVIQDYGDELKKVETATQVTEEVAEADFEIEQEREPENEFVTVEGDETETETEIESDIELASFDSDIRQEFEPDTFESDIDSAFESDESDYSGTH